ncbi:L-threonylcarbamoyladenylate synthase [Pseudoroseicyclus tamaricis]|uniref:Threonylcarbamoyl-AMP synthase n=1 Tax=Pseudoroseicyclus tamaricis TaxID=2705421 RepID=A0A6B2JMQ8_9RHOB|nr:L-threonylcarbamoyladenylate synthase [Pseudoroseicyclus tamaricis]NDV02883.1 threonylcarbamoyl-AMP synthase [Pseudoroseicyclus tamaricis]
MTETLLPDAAGLARAAALLREGQLVAFPTETVYGLGADATNGAAVAGIYAAKGRPSFNPLIVHVASLAQAARLVEIGPEAERLASAFWPGALTLVLPARADNGIASLASAGLPTLGIRLPAHPVARQLLEATGRPVAAPSANPSGRVSPTTAAHVLSGLSGQISAVLDGGPCPVGVESTILGLTGAPTLLRAGGIPAEAIEACLGAPLAAPPAYDTPSSPGQLASHYAPSGTLRLNAAAPRPGETLLGFGPVDAPLNLSPSGDLTEAAATLFSHLHALDAQGATHIAVSPIPDHGLGRAINDRLRRAAAPRR